MKKLLAKIILISLLFSNFNFLFFNQVSAASAGDILISEVEYDPTGEENEAEWFELYNPTNYTIDIGNWTIKEAGTPFYTFPSPTNILPGDFLLVTNDTAKFQVEHPTVTPDLEMSPGTNGLLLLNNTGDSLTLKDDLGNIIDHIAWEGIDGFYLNGDEGFSVCRRNLNDTDTDSEWANNCTPTPGTGTFVTQFPGGVPVASLLWGKADSENYNSGDTVSTFNDRSGNDRNGTANGTPSFDTNNTINFYPTISFDGSSDGIDFPNYSFPVGDKNYTIFTVFQSDLSQNGTLAYVGKETTTNHNTKLSVNSDGSLVDDFDNGAANINLTQSGIILANTPVFSSFNYNTSTDSKNIFVNGKNIATKIGVLDHDTSKTATSDRGLGFNADADGEYFKGNIAEILAYDSELSDLDRQKIDSYLALKYGITLDQSAGYYNYINSYGSILWNSSTNSDYTNNVIGIGQNNLSDLDQKVSKSIGSGSILTIATTSDFTSLNTDISRTSLDDGKFLVIGNNAGNISSQTGELDLGNYISRINREWKVQNTGGVGDVFFKFDGFDENYVLIKNSDGDFNSATTVGNLNTNGEISTTLNDGEYFTLAKPVLNNPPTDITLSGSTIDENLTTGTLIGDLSTTDIDTGDVHIYSFTGSGNDNSSFTLSGSQILSGESFDYETKNSYTIRILTDDQNGGTFEKDLIITINDLDDTVPVITLIGDSTLNIFKNTQYTESGALWTDNVDGTGTLTSANSGAVDTTTIGTYTLEYTYTDQAGNAGNTVTRTVNIVSGDTPVITLNGSGTIEIEIGTSYTDSGAIFTDTEEGTGSITASGTVDTNTLGEYTLTYDYTDNQGNIAPQITRTVKVVDTTAPVVISGTLTGTTTESGATISWQTNEPTTSEIIYGLTTVTNLATGEQDISPKVINHSVTLNNLESCTKYYYKTVSKDASGNETIDGIHNFITKGCVGNSQVLENISSDIIKTASGATGTGILTLDSGNKEVKVEVPVGYFDTGTGTCAGSGVYFQLKEIEKVPVINTLGEAISNGKTLRTYDLSAYCSVQEKIHNFDKNLKVSMRYSNADILGLKENTLKIFRYNTNNSSWQELNNCGIDIINNIVTCETNHFSIFSISGQTQPVVVSSGGGGGSVLHMDICNDTGGDFSGNYYDGECGENPEKEEVEENVKELDNKIIYEDKDIKIIKTKVNGKIIEYSVKNIKSCKIVPNILKILKILEQNKFDYKKLTKLKDLDKVNLKKEILALELNKIVQGDANKNFNANQKITRSEFLKIILLSHCYNYRESDPSDLKYKDLDKTTWQAKVAKKATEIGLINGYDDQTVRMNNVISKAEALKILYNLRILEIKQGEIKELNYIDIPAKWEEKLVKNLETLGIIDSKIDKNKFHPNDGVDREFMVDYLIKTIKFY